VLQQTKSRHVGSTGERGLPRGDREFVDQMMYLMMAPMILYPGWDESFKDRWTQVLLHRLGHHQEIFAEEMCTEYEAMLYVSSATLVAPPEHDWVQVYLWLFQRWKPEVAEANDLKPDRAELNAQQEEKLVGLRRWVFRQQMERLRQKAKGEQAPATAEITKVEVVQERMF